LGLGEGENFTPVNVDLEETRDAAASLPPDIEKLYYSDFEYSPFKLAKRSFALLKYFHKRPEVLREAVYKAEGIDMNFIDLLLNKYAYVLNSTIGILYSLRSELDAMKLLLERNKHVPIKQLNARLDSLKSLLSNVLEIDNEELEGLIEKMDECIQLKKHEDKAECLDELMKAFKFIINFWTMDYYDRELINPPVFPLVPYVLHYDKHLIRLPEEMPENPLKEALANKKGSGECYIYY
jgi:hypothetical protein